MDIFFSLFFKPSVIFLILMKNGCSNNKKSTFLFYKGFSEKHQG